VERVEDLVVRGSLAREVEMDLEKKKSRKSILGGWVEVKRCSCLDCDAMDGVILVVAAASFLQAGTVVTASAHECGLGGGRVIWG
jgi:hypothetical protein